MTRQSMSVQDELWLTMDRPNNLMVVDGAMIMEQPADLEQVRDVFRVTGERFPVFGRRAVRGRRGWVWEDDPDFDLDRHVTAVELPEPADMATLQRFMAEQRSEPLPMDRPRWCAFVVTNLRLPDGTAGSAMVSRFHHSIADGVRLVQVILSMCEAAEPGERAVEAVVSRKSASAHGPGGGGPDNPIATAGAVVGDAGRAGVEAASTVADGAQHTARRLTGGVGSAAAGAAHAVRHPRDGVAQAAGQAKRLSGQISGAVRSGALRVEHGVEHGVHVVRHPDHVLDAIETLGLENRGLNDLGGLAKLAVETSTSTVWTGKPGRTKALAWSRAVPLPEIKAVGRAHGCTVNDVLLAAMAGGLRRYLLGRDGHVDEVLWMVPVNLKPFEEELPPDLGNYFALVFLPMALDIADPVERLKQMQHAMGRIKHSDEAVITFGLQRAVSMSPRQISFFLTNFFANKAVGVLTNVPGPRGQLTFAGIPVRQLIGFAPCSGDQPMTSTIFSYNGTVTVGFATDAALVPDPDVLSEYVVEDLDAMIAATGSGA